MKTIKQFIKYIFLFITGGLTYYGIEMFIIRGWSHWSSFLMGGFAIIFIGLLNEFYFTYEMTVLRQCTIGGIFITLMEYIVGKIVNTDHTVWDYRSMPFNVDGQVCLPASLLWIALSLLAILLDDFIRWKIFDEEKPDYRWV